MAVARTLAAWLALASGVAWGQAEAIVTGPEKSQAGNLVVLSSEGSTADATKWIVPESLHGRSIQFGKQLAFAVRESGEFVFHLVAVRSGEAVDIAVATHTVAITDGFGDVPTPPDPPDEPDQPDPSDPPAGFGPLRDLSERGAKAVADAGTAAKLAAALRAVPQGPLAEMQAAAAAAVETVLLGREGESRNRDWLGEWRRPVNQWLADFGIETAEQYAAAIEAIASGLDAAADGEPVPEPEPAKHQVVMYSRDNCSWCQRWKREVQPRLEAAGWEVSEQFSDGRVPEFLVIVGDRRERLTGYQGTESFSRFMRHLTAAYRRLKSDR